MTAAGSWYEIFIKKYWAEYISRTHLLIPMLQSETPGISLVYTIHTSEDSPSTGWIALLAEVWRITCKVPSAAMTHARRAGSCYTFYNRSAELKLFAKVSVLSNSFTFKYFRYQVLRNILNHKKHTLPVELLLETNLSPTPLQVHTSQPCLWTILSNHLCTVLMDCTKIFIRSCLMEHCLLQN